MITGFIIDLFHTFLFNIIEFFPIGNGLPTEISDAITLIYGYLTAWSWLLPVYDLLTAVIFVISFELGVLGVKAILWIIRTVRGSGS